MSKILFRQLDEQSHRTIRSGSLVVAFIAAIFLFGNPAEAQQPRNPLPPNRPTMPTVDPFNMPPVYSGDPMRTKAENKRLAYLNAERQKSLVIQTNRLVKLASELQAQINGDQHSPLTPDQVRQFQEVEKLAHNIREKMSTSVRPAPALDSGPFMSPR
jgi:hypothetical protein